MDEPVRAYISDWPHVPAYLQATLDPETIAAHGLAILHHALNTGRLTCFVGSGVSMAYGRLGWGDLVLALKDEVTSNASASSMAATVRSWLDRLSLDDLVPGGMPSGTYLAAFQFLERIDQLVPSGDGTPMRTHAAAQLFDDAGHAYQLIKRLQQDLGDASARAVALSASGLSGLTSGAPDQWLNRTNDAVVDDAAAAGVAHRQAIFQLSAGRLDIAAGATAWPARRTLQQALQKLAKDGTVRLPPALRFVVAALARVVAPLQQQLTAPLARTSGAAPGRDRAVFVPPEYDPLLRLAHGMGVKHYITTNYDLDLERLLCDLGYRGPASSQVHGTVMRTALGAQARDTIFSVERATAMIDFALHDNEHALEVMHLHGRVTDPKSMLVTDDDYLNQYLQRGAQSDLAEHAIALAFSTNPVLFVGSGFSEDDILRPLRQFLAERPSRADRPVVAIMPATGTLAQQTVETISLYSRYGVHTHHFGIGAIQEKDGTWRDVRWLAEFTLLLSACARVFEAGISYCKATGDRGPLADELNDAVTKLREKWFKTNPALRDGTQLRWPRALDVALVVDGPRELTLQDAGDAGELELVVLNAIVQAGLNAAIPGDDALDQHRLEACVFKELTRGAHQALNGLGLTIKLAALQSSHRHWLRSRNRLPLPRPQLGEPLRLCTPQHPAKRGDMQAPPPARQHPELLVASRHPLALRPSPLVEPDADLTVPASDRFFSDAPSQTFHELLGALLRQSDNAPGVRADPGRRVFVLYGERGVGKGHFFEALRTERRLGEFFEWTWPPLDDQPSYAAAVYMNFAFSLEVVSCFDRLGELLVRAADAVFPGDSDAEVRAAIGQAHTVLHGHRVALLTKLLALYSAQQPSAQQPVRPRLLVALSPFNMLFDERGNPKNAELFRLIAACLGSASAGAPIDWILLCSGTPLPALFCKRELSGRNTRVAKLDGWSRQLPQFALELLQREPNQPSRERRVQDTLKRLRANVAEPRPGQRKAWLHILREARTATTLAKYFPEVMLCLALRAGTWLEPRQLRHVVNTEPRVRVPQDTAARLSMTILEGSTDYSTASRMVSQVTGRVVRFARSIGLLRPDGRDDTARAQQVDDCANALDQDCRAIYNALQQSRYLITLASAVAAELAWEDDGKRTELQVGDVVAWWQRLLQFLSSSLANDKPDLIVNQVLDQYQELHARSRRLPTELAAPVSEVTLKGPLGWELQQQLLWHLAVAGHPVEADVLVQAPAVRRCAKALSAPNAQEDDILALVNTALNLMVRRCLVFRIEPARVNSGPMQAQPANWRFTTHRFMQRTIFRKLRAPHVEHAHVDQFSLSMWATQPDDVPRPNLTAVQQVAELLAAWTGFPKDLGHVMQTSAFHQALERSGLLDVIRGREQVPREPRLQSLPARMLRASLGVVRTVFSVGAVSHFHDFSGSDDTATAAGGYFEQHRLQVRWLLDQARLLAHADDARQGADKLAQEALAPFFAEEIVWLYNECGLFALVQGRLDSAAAYFQRALRACKRIEPADAHGALWCRIQLNLAVTDIERGRIREARKTLQIIYGIDDENPILRLLARGYLAVVEHYSGNSALARTWLHEVIDDLDPFGQSRAVAIFARHLSELYRLGGEADRIEAVRAADRAIAAATKGGHEDVRQLVRLTRVRLAMENLLGDERDSIARRLDEIERYAQDMGMPRLLADIAFAKAKHLLLLGETRHATHLACKCIEISTVNSLRLRQMTGIALLGRVCEARGFHEASRHLLKRAFALAEACDYSNVRASVRRVHG